MSWNDLRKHRYSQPNGEYFVTFNTVDKRDVFSDFSYACLFCQQIQINEKMHDCEWSTWVLMPDHFHGLLRLSSSGSSLSKIVQSLKGRSAYLLNKQSNRIGRLWQPAFYERALRSEDDRKAIARYILNNPKRRGLVESVKDYPYWDSVFL